MFLINHVHAFKLLFNVSYSQQSPIFNVSNEYAWPSPCAVVFQYPPHDNLHPTRSMPSMPDTLRINLTETHPLPTLPSPEHALFTHLKARILSIALALYGSSCASPTSAFDIVTYTIPLTHSLEILINGRSMIPSTLYGVALIAYTSPREFTSWERLATAENSGSVLEAMQELLQDMQAGMGSVMGRS